jgi:hypothetical protein
LLEISGRLRQPVGWLGQHTAGWPLVSMFAPMQCNQIKPKKSFNRRMWFLFNLENITKSVNLNTNRGEVSLISGLINDSKFCHEKDKKGKGTYT